MNINTQFEHSQKRKCSKFLMQLISVNTKIVKGHNVKKSERDQWTYLYGQWSSSLTSAAGAAPNVSCYITHN